MNATRCGCCGCCGHNPAVTTRSLTRFPAIHVPICGKCVDCSSDKPSRVDALGECKAWFYGYTLANGETFNYPNTPAADGFSSGYRVRNADRVATQIT